MPALYLLICIPSTVYCILKIRICALVQVRIAAAYALANGAVIQKQKMKERAAARLTNEQAEQNGAMEGNPSADGYLSGGGTADAALAQLPKLAAEPQTPRTYRVNSEFYRSPDAASGAASLPSGPPSVGGPVSAATSGAPAGVQAAGGAGNAPGAGEPGLDPVLAAAGAEASAAGGGRDAAASSAADTVLGPAEMPAARTGAAGEAGNGTGRETAGTADGDADADSEPVSNRSGSWLGWLGWSRGGDGAGEGDSQEVRAAEQAGAADQGGQHAEEGVGAVTIGKGAPRSGSNESSPRSVDTPRPAISPGALSSTFTLFTDSAVTQSLHMTHLPCIFKWCHKCWHLRLSRCPQVVRRTKHKCLLFVLV